MGDCTRREGGSCHTKALGDKVISREMHALRRFRIPLIIALLFLVVCLSIVLWAYFSYRQARSEIDEGISHLRAAEQVFRSLIPAEWEVENLDNLAEANQELVLAEDCFRRAKSRIGHFQFLLPLGEMLPKVGGDLKSAPYLLDAAIHISVAGQDAYGGVEPILGLLRGKDDSAPANGSEALSRRAIDLLEEGRPRLIKAEEGLAKAAEERLKIDEGRLTEKVAGYVGELDSKLPTLQSSIEHILIAPELLEGALGFREPQTYLILSHSADELRPTGGLVTVYGEMSIEGGDIVESKYDISPQDVQAPTVYEPINIPSWWFRFQRPVWMYWDSNWVADFPTAAEDAEWFYEAGGNTTHSLDGVVGVDLNWVQLLLEVVGPVEDPFTGEEVNDQNLRELVFAHMVKARHKQFLVDISEQITARLTEVRADQLLDLTNALFTGLREKHIMFFFNDSDLHDIVADRRWDGAINPSEDDYLFLVDSGLQGGKSSMLIDESIDYEVTVNSDNTLNSRATITYYYNKAKFDSDPAARYGFAAQSYLNQVRLYVPARSIWYDTEGGEELTLLAREEDKKAFVSAVLVPLGERAEITFHYTVAQGIVEEADISYYRLVVQKQASTLAHRLTITVILPEGAELISTSTEPCSIKGNRIEFCSSLSADRSFEVAFR